LTVGKIFEIDREFSFVRATASNSAYSGYPELWILWYPAHRYHAGPSPGFQPTTLWLRVRRPNHSVTTIHVNATRRAPPLSPDPVACQLNLNCACNHS
jgi:hypothetical protein